jgi:hypothetical protein
LRSTPLWFCCDPFDARAFHAQASGGAGRSF